MDIDRTYLSVTSSWPLSLVCINNHLQQGETTFHCTVETTEVEDRSTRNQPRNFSHLLQVLPHHHFQTHDPHSAASRLITLVACVYLLWGTWGLWDSSCCKEVLPCSCFDHSFQFPGQVLLYGVGRIHLRHKFFLNVPRVHGTANTGPNTSVQEKLHGSDKRQTQEEKKELFSCIR